MFGHKAEGLTTGWEYGCKPPTAGLDAALHEMRLRNRFWNDLVRIERDYRTKSAPWVTSDLDEAIKEFQNLRNEWRTRLKAHKAAAAWTTIEYGKIRHTMEEALAKLNATVSHRNFQPAPGTEYRQIPSLCFPEYAGFAECKKIVNECNEALKPLYEAAKALRKELRLKNAEPLKILDQERETAVAKARKNCGLYWCNADEVLANYNVARRMVMKIGANLQFHTFRDEGKFTVRRSGGFTTEQVFSTAEQLMLTPPTMDRRGKLWATARMLIYRDLNNDPVFFEIPVCLHRPLPPDAVVHAASVRRQKCDMQILPTGHIQPNYSYQIKLTLRRPTPPPADATKPITTVQFCCCLQEDRSLKVATVTTGNETTEVILPRAITSRFEEVDDLESIRKKHQNQANAAVRAIRDKAPSWFQETTLYAHAWKSPQPLLNLYVAWKDQRFAGDEEAFAALYYFRGRHIHLNSWEMNLRDQLLRRRREVYRILAARLAKSSSRVILGELPPSRKKRAETETQELRNKRKWSDRAALFSLQTIIKNTARREGVVVETVEPLAVAATAQ